MKAYRFIQDSFGFVELVIVYITMSLVVLKVLNMIDWSWLEVLLPTSGFIVLFALEFLLSIIAYKRGEDYEVNNQNMGKSK